MRIVPGSFSRSMIFFTAIAAVMFTACPELCPSPWPGRALDHRLVIGDARLLRRLRDAVDVRAERDHRLARCPSVAMNAVGMPAMPSSTVKPFFFEDVDQVAVGLDLLEAELAEAEDRVDHLLRERLSSPSTSATRLGLEPLGARVVLRGARRRGAAAGARAGWFCASGAAVSTAVDREHTESSCRRFMHGLLLRVAGWRRG